VAPAIDGWSTRTGWKRRKGGLDVNLLVAATGGPAIQTRRFQACSCVMNTMTKSPSPAR
jgi:hypothetical protein